MKNKFKDLFFWNLFLLIIISFLINVYFIFHLVPLVVLNHYVVSHLKPNYIQNNNVIDSCDFFVKKDIEDIAWNVSRSHDYKSNVYDCTQFSEQVVNQLKGVNVSAYCVSGYVFDDTRWYPHTWVELLYNNRTIPIEATGGYIIPDDIYVRFYNISKKGYCL